MLASPAAAALSPAVGLLESTTSATLKVFFSSDKETCYQSGRALKVWHQMQWSNLSAFPACHVAFNKSQMNSYFSGFVLFPFFVPSLHLFFGFFSYSLMSVNTSFSTSSFFKRSLTKVLWSFHHMHNIPLQRMWARGFVIITALGFFESLGWVNAFYCWEISTAASQLEVKLPCV